MKYNYSCFLFGVFVPLIILYSCSKKNTTSNTIITENDNIDSLTSSNSSSSDTTFATAYVEVNNNSLEDVACYTKADSGQSIFKFAIIFAANINLGSDGKPTLYFNDKVESTLSSSAILNLHNRGIKVLLSILGNHQDAGWACFGSYADADAFATQCADAVKKYSLDGIDIDDEYSSCEGNTSSLVWAAAALKAELPDTGLVTKALWEDDSYFATSYKYKKLGDYLDYGWEMSYGNTDYDSRINKYVSLGMSKTKLGLGVDVNGSDISSAAEYVIDHKLASFMVYNVSKDKTDNLNTASQILWNVNIKDNCLD